MNPQDYYRACHGKIKYKTRAYAVSMAKKFARSRKDVLLPYKCFYCKNFHLGHPTPQKLEQIKTYVERVRATRNVS